MDGEFLVEKVRAEYKEEIAELSKDIWEGRDYLPKLFDDWVEQEGFYCGKVDGRIVAVGKYTWMPDKSIWLEGLRTDPKLWGKGYGRLMGDVIFDMANATEHRAIRYMTSNRNPQSIHMGEKRGFERIGTYHYLIAEDDEIIPSGENIEACKVSDFEEIVTFAEASSELQELKGYYLEGWTAYTMTREKIREEIGEGRCYAIREDGKIRGLAFYTHYEPHNSASVAFIAGGDEEKLRLLRWGMDVSLQSGRHWYTIKTPNDKIKELAEEAGLGQYEVNQAYLYEYNEWMATSEEEMKMHKHSHGGAQHPLPANQKVHEHGGRSSRDMLDAGEILEKADLQEGMVFLDAGCGDGYVALEAAKTASEVYAVDVDRDGLEKLMIEVSEQDVKNMHVVISDLTNHLPVEEGKIDLCYLGNVFHGMAANGELNDVVPRLKCSLSAKGKLAVLEFRVDNTPGPPIDVRVSPQDIGSMLEPYGFVVDRAVNVGDYHYLVVLGKKE